MSGPLEGRTVLLTRDEGLADAVRALGAAVRVATLVHYESVPTSTGMFGWDWVVFTSPRAVRFLGKSLVDVPHIAVVGPATAGEVERHGGVVALMPDRHDAVSLAKRLAHEKMSGRHVLFPCSDRALDTIERRLADEGATVVRRVVYRAELATELEPGITEGVDVVVFLAPSAVEAFAQLGGDLAAAPVLAIGPTTAEAIRARGVAPVVAASSDREGLLEALVDMEVRS